MKKLTILIYLVTICIYTNAQQNKNGIYSFDAVPRERPAEYEFLSASAPSGAQRTLKKPSPHKSGVQLPYPVILIHGVNGEAEQWDIFTDSLDLYYNLNFGGRFDFCLNYDGDNSTANLDFWPVPGADLALFTGTWAAGDYYYVNFNTGDDGSYDPVNPGHKVLSNESAAFKQGRAVREAVRRVLQLTGRKKVVLLTHSMGGLASRQYLQNPGLWQADGKHHVAKLITAGTPHGGSDASLTQLGDILIGMNDRSEGLRDLRTTYTYTGDSGVFLFGGVESFDVMDDMFWTDYYNVDVNCNGHTGDLITGLNHKPMTTDHDLALIIGECSGCPEATPGDGVVLSYSADLNNFYHGITQNIFRYPSFNLVQTHNDLLSIMYLLMQGLDEPNNISLAYYIGFDTTYIAFITPQSPGTNQHDFDMFKFYMPANGNVQINMSNIYIYDLAIRIVDSAGQTAGTTMHSNGAPAVDYSQTLNAGEYSIEISGVPTAASYLHPYKFKMTKNLFEGVQDNTAGIPVISLFPNPAPDHIKTAGITGKTVIKLYSMLGKLLNEIKTEDDITIDISHLPDGVYTFVTESNNNKTVERIMISK